MYTVHEGSPSPLPMSEEERQKVREQLNRLLETHHFSHSKRYPPLLRFIVEETLAGRGDFLKERLLGVRVFDRPADYDTAADPIVRVTIAEIRKRIAQYYHDEEHDAEIRIELLPGRYAPEFRARGHKRQIAPIAPSAAEIAELEAMGVPRTDLLKASPDTRAAASSPRRWPIAAALLLVVGIATAIAVHLFISAPIEQMWAPLLDSPHPIMFCLPTDVEKRRNPNGEIEQPVPAMPSVPTFLEWQALGENVVYSDVLATLHIANVLAEHHHDYQARLTNMITLEDLREGPAILIGGLDNQWTMRALAPLRYHFAGSDEDRYWIADARNPHFRDWSLDLKMKYVAVTRDYAIIARLYNEQTGQPQMIVAGIGTSGTSAGGEFISDPARMKELSKRIGEGFKDRQFEVVLSTDVVNGVAGSPKIIAVSVW